jgi:hypothetical protein
MLLTNTQGPRVPVRNDHDMYPQSAGAVGRVYADKFLVVLILLLFFVVLCSSKYLYVSNRCVSKIVRSQTIYLRETARNAE